MIKKMSWSSLLLVLLISANFDKILCEEVVDLEAHMPDIDLAMLETKDNDHRLHAVGYLDSLFPDGKTTVFRRTLQDKLSEIYCKANRKNILAWQRKKHTGKQLDKRQEESIGLWEYLSKYMQTLEPLYFTQGEVERMLRDNLPWEWMSSKIVEDTRTLHGDYIDHETRKIRMAERNAVDSNRIDYDL